MEGLEPQTLYRYRIRFQNDEGNSEWSQVTSVSTTSKCVACSHVAIMENVPQSSSVFPHVICLTRRHVWHDGAVLHKSNYQ